MTQGILFKTGLFFMGAGGLTLFVHANSDAPAAADFKPVATWESVHGEQTRALDRIGKLLQDKGAKNRAKTIMLDAELLAELANVNIYSKDKSDQQGSAAKMRDVALELAAEAKKNKTADEAKMAQLYEQLTKNPGANAAPPATPFKPAAPVAALMNGQDILFKRMRDNLDKKDAKDRIASIATDAEVLAELANVNFHHQNKADYQGWASTLRDTALALSAEAKKPTADEAKLQTLTKKLDDTCLACHDKYKE